MSSDIGDKDRVVRIGEAARLVGSKPDTLRNWEKTGELLPVRKTAKGTRYYRVGDLFPEQPSSSLPDVALCYARVSNRTQTEDLKRQQAALEAFCEAKGWRTRTIKDVGSGLNFKKKGLADLIDAVMGEEVSRLVLTHKDRLLRFGSEIVFAVCDRKGIEVIIIHETEPASFEKELADDIMAIITVFSSRLHGKRSGKNKKLAEAVMSGDTKTAAELLSNKRG